jgi:hypothetical protein
MHVIAFAPAAAVVEDESGGLHTQGFPMTSAHVDGFPQQLTLPLVLAVHTQGGTDYDPRLYIAAHSPEGDRLGVLECAWHWPDEPGQPVKYWVLTRYLPFVVQSPGLYTIGLYDSLQATETDHLFPLPVLRFNPLVAPQHGDIAASDPS